MPSVKQSTNAMALGSTSQRELYRVLAAMQADLTLLNNVTGTVPVALGAVTTELGVQLTTQATTVTGLAQLSNKEMAIVVPAGTNPATGKNLSFVTVLPADADISQPVYVKALVQQVKGGASLEALTFDVEAYFCTAGDVANVDACGTAAQAMTEAGSVLSFALTALDAPATLSVVLAVGGTNTADVVRLYGVWLEYSKTISLTLEA